MAATSRGSPRPCDVRRPDPPGRPVPARPDGPPRQRAGQGGRRRSVRPRRAGAPHLLWPAVPPPSTSASSCSRQTRAVGRRGAATSTPVMSAPRRAGPEDADDPNARRVRRSTREAGCRRSGSSRDRRGGRRLPRTSRGRSPRHRSRGTWWCLRPGRARCRCRRSARPLASAICRARVRVSPGVRGTSSIFQSGWKALKCIGTSGPQCSTTQRVIASISSSESLRPGISRFVSSTQVSVWFVTYSIVSRTAARSRAAHPAVEVLGEALEVDVRGVHVPVELGARLRVDVAGSHRDRMDAPGAARVRGVDGVLGEDHRIVVGEGDARAAEPLGRLRDGGRRGGVGQGVDVTRLGDVPVLAELAGEVAACGAEGEHRRPGQEVVQRLLLHRVDAVAGRATIGRQHDRVVLSGTDEAEPTLPFVQPTVARAEVALDPAVLERMPPRRGPRIGDRLGRSSGLGAPARRIGRCPSRVIACRRPENRASTPTRKASSRVGFRAIGEWENPAGHLSAPAAKSGSVGSPHG